MFYIKIWKCDFVDIFFNLGLCIFYDWVLNIFIELGDKICYYYEQEKVVCFFEFKGGFFIIVVVDNIDYNLSLMIFYDLFYGIGILLFQYLDENCSGI